jgi:RIO kinase 1
MRYKWDYQDELAEYDEGEVHPRTKTKTGQRPGRAQVVAQLVEAPDTRGDFAPSFGSKSAEKFNVSRHEREWILTYLSGFYDDHLIEDVLKPVKGGKEATVYCCLATPETGAEYLAAKLYRPRVFRNLRNDSLYRIGRDLANDQGKMAMKRREALALSKGSRFGQELRHGSWLSNEVETLKLLHAAGADVPRVYGQNDNAILMDYFGEPDWAAPVLQNVTLERREARALFDRTMGNVELMLEHNRVHGDLSAHNILYWEGEISIIDFPQAVDPVVNPYAQEIFQRDVTRVCQYFARYGIQSNPIALATSLWSRYVVLD